MRWLRAFVVAPRIHRATPTKNEREVPPDDVILCLMSPSTGSGHNLLGHKESWCVSEKYHEKPVHATATHARASIMENFSLRLKWGHSNVQSGPAIVTKVGSLMAWTIGQQLIAR